MTIWELTKEQRLQLKRAMLIEMFEREGDTPSYSELSMADSLVTDLQLFERYGNTHFTTGDFPAYSTCNVAIMENVARIAADCLGRLVDKLHMSKSSEDVILEYIIPWAEEAETEYRRTVDEREANGDYLDWLDEFVEKKMKEFDA